MTSRLIPMRVLRPDGSTAAEGPLLADLRLDVERETGQPWWMLEVAGWRIVPVPEHVP